MLALVLPEVSLGKQHPRAVPFPLGVLKAGDKAVPSVWLHYPCSTHWGLQFLWLDQDVWNYTLAACAKELFEVWRYGFLMYCLGVVGQLALYVLPFSEQKRHIRIASDH